MIPTNFSYHRAGSVKEAVDLLAKHGDDAKILAGGHSLIPALKLRLNQVGMLIDIAKIPALKSIETSNGLLYIGGCCTHGQIAHSSLVKDSIPMLAEAAELIGDVQVRNMGTIGGSLAHADPAADWPALMLASNAVISVQGPKGSRDIPAADFFTGFFGTALDDHEVITGIRIPLLAANTKTAYRKFMQPASRFAIVGCAAVVTNNGGTASEVSVAFTGVSEAAFRDSGVESALKGKALTADNIALAAGQAAADVSIMSDHFASEPYRKHLAEVYARRALRAAAG